MTAAVRLTRLIGPVLLVALLTSCGSDTDAEPAAGPTPSSTPSPSTSARQVDPNGFPLADRPDCAADAGGDWVRSATTSEGNGVAFLLLGTGQSGVVLAPESNGGLCAWLPYAKELATTYRVALFDWKEPRAEVPALAAAALRATGVRRVVLAGASQGGALAMSEAHQVRPRPVGVLSFSGELTLPGFDGRPGIRKWHGPLLALGSTDDPYFDSAAARALRQLHPGPETLVMLPGKAHGIELLQDPQQARVRTAVDRFLADVLG